MKVERCEAGSVAPDLEFQTATGERARLSALHKGPVVLIFVRHLA